MKDLKIGILSDIYKSLLTKKQINIISSYYDFDLSLSEIAENEGITRQAVLDTLKKSETQLLEYEKNMKIYDRNIKLQEYVEELRRTNNPDEIERISEKIENLI